jgi:hypothetical protein
VASVLAVSIGVLVLLGWALGLEPLKRVLPGFVAMNPATAALFVLTGVALACARRAESSEIAKFIARLFTVAVVIAAVSEFAEMTGLWHSQVDELLFASKLSTSQDVLPNRMAVLLLDLRGRSSLSVLPGARLQ